MVCAFSYIPSVVHVSLQPADSHDISLDVQTDRVSPLVPSSHGQGQGEVAMLVDTVLPGGAGPSTLDQPMASLDAAKDLEEGELEGMHPLTFMAIPRLNHGS